MDIKVSVTDLKPFAEIEIPWPVSVNKLYTHFHGNKILTAEGRKYRARLESELRGIVEEPYDGKVMFVMHAYPPDKRKRDLDNLLKVTQDSFTSAKVFNDDSQIDVLHIERHEPLREMDGLCVVKLYKLS